MTHAQVSCVVGVLLPTVAVASEGGLQASGGVSLFSSFLQMALALLVVVGLILLVYYGTTRLVKAVPSFGQAGRLIRVLEVRPLGPRKALVLVEVGGEYLLLASTDNQLALIKQINMVEEIEVLEERPARGTFLSFLQRSSGNAP